MKFNKDIFICAAEAVDCGHEDFAFSCSALYFVASESLFFKQLSGLGIKPIRRSPLPLIRACEYEESYGELMAHDGRHLCVTNVREINDDDRNAMREHRVLMLLLAGEVLSDDDNDL
jgi:hypothetical protein